eukprot:CAMPEP_0206212934 /NCGR_PEP_ID=MMETSP0047_2-20121206/847_1 /ASSEMBLY_ACC=CAM_ASM_000192 /TAXON_ID=195065 /ORGANISM="Chroomonas mesostigmatica_cf, Strain CCMP1168" /LENGTH=298 /DNA_ID=CAMNT_0053635037 /DNA_START=19 /DNA_END=912 /DNA_ORIENTATION=+
MKTSLSSQVTTASAPLEEAAGGQVGILGLGLPHAKALEGTADEAPDEGRDEEHHAAVEQHRCVAHRAVDVLLRVEDLDAQLVPALVHARYILPTPLPALHRVPNAQGARGWARGHKPGLRAPGPAVRLPPLDHLLLGLEAGPAHRGGVEGVDIFIEALEEDPLVLPLRQGLPAVPHAPHGTLAGQRGEVHAHVEALRVRLLRPPQGHQDDAEDQDKDPEHEEPQAHGLGEVGCPIEHGRVHGVLRRVYKVLRVWLCGLLGCARLGVVCGGGALLRVLRRARLRVGALVVLLLDVLPPV